MNSECLLDYVSQQFLKCTSYISAYIHSANTHAKPVMEKAENVQHKSAEHAQWSLNVVWPTIAITPTRWTMLLIRTLGAHIRTSLVCEGSLHVMSFKMVDC